MEGAIKFNALLVAAALPLAWPAQSLELPRRKPGLWETRAVLGGTYKVQRRCFEEGERSAFIEAVGMEACTRSVQKAGPGYMMQADCRYRGRTLRGGLQIAGDFAAELSGRVRTTMTEPGETTPATRLSFTFTSRRLGECRPVE